MNIVCILRENLPSEVEAFRKDVWQDEPIFLDHQFAFFKAIGGGEANEKTVQEFLAARKNPSPADKANQSKAMHLAEGYMTPEHHNMFGQGLMTGGVYVVQRGGAMQWAHHESFGGDTCDVDGVVQAAKMAAAPSKL